MFPLTRLARSVLSIFTLLCLLSSCYHVKSWQKISKKKPDSVPRKELVSSKKWTEKNGMICFSVTSNGKTGREWQVYLFDKGFKIGYESEDILLSKYFQPTKGLTYNIKIFKATIFAEKDLTTGNIYSFAASMNLKRPNLEIACLIRDLFTDDEIREMGLEYIVAMHTPVNKADGSPSWLDAGRSSNCAWRSSYLNEPGHEWDARTGFAFIGDCY